MKKTITVILILIFLGVGLFAADPTANFDVVTQVASSSDMKITATLFTVAGATRSLFNAAPAANSSVTVTTVGSLVSLPAFLTTISNNRKGYSVSMSAKAMANAEKDNYINYTVTCGGASVTTTDGDTPIASTLKVVDKAAPVKKLEATSNQVKITINQTDYEKAGSGDYTGTIYFTFTSKS